MGSMLRSVTFPPSGISGMSGIMLRTVASATIIALSTSV